jgi:TatD DNase family protein
VLVDTHAHLDFEDFEGDRDDVLDRARAAGVVRIINPGCDLATTRRAIELAERYDTILAAAGIHPNSTANPEAGSIDDIARMAEHPRVAAIGETGLDFYRDRAPRDVQAGLFREHLALARKRALPVIIHFRNVAADGIDMTGREWFEGISGVFHCFGGSPQFAREILDMGFYIGFDGPLTYPKSDRAAVARIVPLEQTLIETDAPFLTPQSHRGSRNEPAYVAEVASALAAVHGCPVDEVVRITGENARRLFGLDRFDGQDIVRC